MKAIWWMKRWWRRHKRVQPAKLVSYTPLVRPADAPTVSVKTTDGEVIW